MTRCLGKLPAQRRNGMTLYFSDYLTRPARSILAEIEDDMRELVDRIGAGLARAATPAPVPSAPPSGDYDAKLASAALNVWANDRYGSCFWAAAANSAQTVDLVTGRPFTLTVDDVLAAYSGCTGFDPTRPETDQGTVMVDGEDYLRRVGLGGRKILGSFAVNWRNWYELCLAAYLAGGVIQGWALPLAAQNDAPWTGKSGALAGDDAPGSWGGHATQTPTWAPGGAVTTTWAERKPYDLAYVHSYGDECTALLWPDWTDAAHTAPNGIALAELERDLKAAA